jgi:hypothetical protein
VLSTIHDVTGRRLVSTIYSHEISTVLRLNFVARNNSFPQLYVTLRVPIYIGKGRGEILDQEGRYRHAVHTITANKANNGPLPDNTGS